MIAWLAPTGGLAVLAALPVAIHLLSKRIRNERPFPGIALLTRSEGGRSKVSVLRQYLSLLVRILAIIALLIAAAMPVLRAAGLGGGSAAVVVIDASASMRQVSGGTTAFTRAIGHAGRLVDSLAGRPLLVIVAGTPGERSGPVPETDPGAARALLAKAVPGWGAGSLDSAVAAGVEALKGSGDLYVLSDGSRTALAGIDSGAMPPGIAWHPLNVDGGGTNRAITAISVEPGTVIAGRPVTIRATVVNRGPAAALNVHLDLAGNPSDHPLQLPTDGSLTIERTYTPEKPGTLVFTASIVGGNDGDVLPGDDQRSGSVAVRSGAPLRLFSDSDAGDAAGPAKPLLAAAQAAGLVVDQHPGQSLARDLAAADPDLLVVTAGLAGQSARDLGEASAALLEHLRRGGIWLQVVVSDADALITAAGIDPPSRPGALVDLSSRNRGLGLGKMQLDHPLAAGLRGREPLLARFETWHCRPAIPLPGSTVLLACSDGSSALSLRPVAAGWWVQLAVSPADQDSNLAALEILPLLIPHLPEITGRSRLADAAVACDGTRRGGRASNPEGKPATILEGAVRLDRPGLWRIDDLPLAVAIPAGESDLTQMPAGPGTEVAADPRQAISQLRDEPLWNWALLAALTLFAIELTLAGGLPRKARS